MMQLAYRQVYVIQRKLELASTLPCMLKVSSQVELLTFFLNAVMIQFAVWNANSDNSVLLPGPVPKSIC